MGLDTSLRNVIRDVVKDEVRGVVRAELRAALATSEHAPEPTQYLAIARAAEIADVQPATVRAWINRGELPGHRAGRLLRVRMSDLRTFLARQGDQQETALDLDERARQILDRARSGMRRR
jgi:excisionase family DNA binding protein